MSQRFRRRAASVTVTLADWTTRFADTLSTPGLLVATLFFAASLTPSLLPRTAGMQGVLSGVSLAAGYGLGVFGRWLWGYLELPLPDLRIQRVTTLTATGFCLAVALLFLRQAVGWQNSIRSLMELEPVHSARPVRVGMIAALLGIVLLGAGRLFGLVFRTITHWLDDHIPRRVANVTGAFAAVAVFWVVIDGVFFDTAIRTMDASFQQVDALIEPDVEQATESRLTGSPESLVGWGDLGRRGRAFVAGAPDASELLEFFGEDARDSVRAPIRVYVGLNSAGTIEQRAHLALAELQRVGAFARSVLVIVTPTGTGWIDPAAIRTLEYLHAGDVATVGVQYSYLPSWLSLLVEPEYGDRTARAVFAEIYGYWTKFPPESRPALYLYGLSLGALNSERSTDFYDVIADPFAGALWAGPPFRSTTWRAITAERQPDSPAWLPRFRDGSIVRFTNQEDALDIPGTEWGPIRIAYLQYASDPITFFDPRMLYRPPEWMDEPRGPDVSPELRWYPVVTMLQLAVDILAAHTAPTGYGHVYAPGDYIDAWIGVTDPPAWTAREIDRLKGLFEKRQRPGNDL